MPLFVQLFLMLTVLSCVHGHLPTDRSMTAIEAGDATAIIEGCGQQATAGFVFCRKMEGQPATDSLVFIVPPVKCSKSSCASIKIFNPKADISLALDVPKGQTRTEVEWKQLTNRATFELSDRGLWPFIYQITFTDNDGSERTLIMEGEIRLRVYKKGYLPLTTGQSDPSFAWIFREHDQTIKITTKGRVYLVPASNP